MSDTISDLFDELGKSNIKNDQSFKNLNIAEAALLNRAEVVTLQNILVAKGICTEKELNEVEGHILNSSPLKEELDKIRTTKKCLIIMDKYKTRAGSEIRKMFNPDFTPPEVDENDKKWFKENANRVLSKEDYESWLKVLEIE